jgi:PTS system ascorbate-specific IIB component
MMKEFKIMTVCGAGVGTSTLLRMNINKAFKELNAPFNVRVEHTSISRARGARCDLIVSFPTFAKELENVGVDVILINNLVDQNEINTKIENYLIEKNLINKKEE